MLAADRAACIAEAEAAGGAQPAAVWQRIPVRIAGSAAAAAVKHPPAWASESTLRPSAPLDVPARATKQADAAGREAALKGTSQAAPGPSTHPVVPAPQAGPASSKAAVARHAEAAMRPPDQAGMAVRGAAAALAPPAHPVTGTVVASEGNRAVGTSPVSPTQESSWVQVSAADCASAPPLPAAAGSAEGVRSGAAGAGGVQVVPPAQEGLHAGREAAGGGRPGGGGGPEVPAGQAAPEAIQEASPGEEPAGVGALEGRAGQREPEASQEAAVAAAAAIARRLARPGALAPPRTGAAPASLRPS